MVRTLRLIAVPALMFAACPLAWAAPIFSQTPTIDAGYTNDRDSTYEFADNFTVAASATARSVTWRGFYFASGTPQYPLNFSLNLYNGSASVPNAIATTSTPVAFTSAAELVDTRLNFNGRPIYEFSASIAPTALTAGQTYWFSPLGDTTDNAANHFNWATSGTLGNTAYRTLPDGSFLPTTTGDHYFIIDDAPVPEPTMLVIAGAGLMALRRRRV